VIMYSAIVFHHSNPENCLGMQGEAEKTEVTEN